MRRVMMLVVVLALAACQDSPFDFAVERPQFTVEDQPTFFWLPPLGNTPASVGSFNPDVYPLVEVCRPTETGCERIVAFDRAPTGSNEFLFMNVEAELYQANWKTRLDGDVRIRVYGTFSVDGDVIAGVGMPLGDTLVTLVSSGNINAESTVPIKFRIDKTCDDCAETFIGPEAATLTLQGSAQVDIPEGALPAGVGYGLTIRRYEGTEPCLPIPNPQYPGCYEIFLTDLTTGARIETLVDFDRTVTIYPCLDEEFLDLEPRLGFWKWKPELGPTTVERLERTGTTSTGLDCSGTTSTSSSGMLQRTFAAAGALLRPLSRAFTPQVAFATTTSPGFGSRSFSRLGWVDELSVTWLTPLGTVSTAPNVDVAPEVPWVEVTCVAAGGPCTAAGHVIFQGAAPRTISNGDSWYQVNWQTPSNLVSNSLYDVRVLLGSGGPALGAPQRIRAVAGGTKTKEPFTFETGRTLPLKFTLYASE
jgi:hypothetical protein